MESLLYIVLAIIGLLVVMQLYVRLSVLFRKGKRLEGIGGALGREINSGNRILVYFYSNSCAACRPMTPVVDRLKKEYRNIYKINLSKDMDTGRQFGVMGTPATILIENARIRNYNLGAKTETFLRKLLSE